MNSPPAEIQRLHQQDIDAPVLMDVGKLASLWAEDGVLLSQGDEPLVGKAAIEASLKRTLAANPTMEVIKYVLEIADFQIMGTQLTNGALSRLHANSLRVASRRVFAPGFCA